MPKLKITLSDTLPQSLSETLQPMPSLSLQITLHVPHELKDKVESLLGVKNSSLVLYNRSIEELIDTVDKLGETKVLNSALSEFELEHPGSFGDEQVEALIHAGIPHTAEYKDHVECETWDDHVRFDEHGAVHQWRLSHDNQSIPVADLFELLQEDPEQLHATILQRAKSIAILPWENQVEYAKRYRLARALNTE